MLRTHFVFLLALLAAFAVPVGAQPAENVVFRVTVVDGELNLKTVPKFSLIIRKPSDPAFSEIKLSTSPLGNAGIALAPGSYTVISERPLEFQDRRYSWEHHFTLDAGKSIIVDLSSDNARIGGRIATPTGRDISRGGELFKSLRDGVVTVQGELGPGTGFIIDQTGLVLTNQHVIDQSNEIRVRFDKYT